MENANKKQHEHINYFNPGVQKLKDAYQEFLFKINNFNAGDGYENFNDFLSDEAFDYANDGDGVTYVIWNIIYNDKEKEIDREIVAFYTLEATAIPYEDRIRLEPDEAERYKKEFDIEICGIPAVEIKMFAVNQQYQDLFFEYEDEDLPISAWVLRNIIDFVYDLSKNTMGFKAVFLHSVPDAKQFYMRNGFQIMAINMMPLHSVDSEFTAMYLPLYEIHMNYDK